MGLTKMLSLCFLGVIEGFDVCERIAHKLAIFGINLLQLKFMANQHRVLLIYNN